MTNLSISPATLSNLRSGFLGLLLLLLSLMYQPLRVLSSSPGAITLDMTPVTINVAMPEYNNLPVTQAQMDRFTAKYPQVTIQFVSLPKSTSDLVDYLVSKYFSTQSNGVDLFTTDVIYPGQLEPYCLDLLQYNLTDVAEQFSDGVIQNNMAKGKLVALPLYSDYGVLYYRSDLLAKYGFNSPPKTYAEVANMSEIILMGEHGSGVNPNLQGYSFQGLAYEGLTCNFMEWLASYQGGKILDLNANGNVEVTINNAHAIEGLDTFASWIGSIAPVTAIDAKEDESEALFRAGNAIFLRHWPGEFTVLSTQASLTGKYAATYPPSSIEGQQGYSTLGGWGVSINKYSSHPEWTVELVKHMMSPDELFIRGRDAGQVPPVKAGVIPNAGAMCNRTIPSWCDVPSPNIISRPSTLSAPHYGDLSQLIYRGMTDVLLGRYNATKLVTGLECDIGTLLNINIPRCLPDAIIAYSQPDIVTQALTATSAVLMGLIGVVLLVTLIFRENRVMKASSPTFLYVMLFGALMGTSAVIPMVTYEPTIHTCRVQIWLAHLGFIFLFGALFLKTYRLQAIFGETRIKLVNITDMQLLGKQGLLCLASAIYLMVWTIVDSPTPTLVVDSGTSYLVCKSNASFWPNLILLAEGLFIGYGIYLCIAVRSIPNLFNESQFIGIAIYNVGALGSIILLISKIALTQYNKAVLFETVGVLVVVTVTVSVIFVPKFLLMASVMKAPEASSLGTMTSTPSGMHENGPSMMDHSKPSGGDRKFHLQPSQRGGSTISTRVGASIPYGRTPKQQESRMSQSGSNKDLPLKVLTPTAASSTLIQLEAFKNAFTQVHTQNAELRRIIAELGGDVSQIPGSADLSATLASLSSLESELSGGHAGVRAHPAPRRVSDPLDSAPRSLASIDVRVREVSDHEQPGQASPTESPMAPAPSPVSSAEAVTVMPLKSPTRIRIHVTPGSIFNLNPSPTAPTTASIAITIPSPHHHPVIQTEPVIQIHPSN